MLTGLNELQNYIGLTRSKYISNSKIPSTKTSTSIPEKQIAKQYSILQKIGLFGGILILIGGLGSAATPVLHNPITGKIIIGFLARMPIVALSIVFTGVFILVLSWLLIGRLIYIFKFNDKLVSHLNIRHLKHTFILWAIPFIFTPPMFSRDIYSYLAQSELTLKGMDPYQISPSAGLGLTHEFTRNIPTIWRDTPAPYGPLFLWVGSIFAKIGGENLIILLILHRIFALIGVALIFWTLPRIAKHLNVSPSAAFWLAILNPLFFLHLISGIHNEAIMLGLMMSGIYICLKFTYLKEKLKLKQFIKFSWGIILLSAASLIKIPAILSLGFLGIHLANNLGVTPNILRLNREKKFIHSAAISILKQRLIFIAVTLYISTVFLLITFFVSLTSHLKLGWISTLNTASEVRSWLSFTTSIGVITGQFGILMGLGDHTDTILTIIKPITTISSLVIVLYIIYCTMQRKISAIGGLGLSLTAIVLLLPVVQPWYLLWAIIPIVNWKNVVNYQLPLITVSVIVCVMPLPTGAELKPYLIVQAITVAIIMTALLISLILNSKIIKNRNIK